MCNAIPGESHFNLFNKDTRDIFMLCILCYVPVIVVVVYLWVLIIYHCHSFILFSARFSFILCLNLFHCSLVKRKRFNSDPGLYSRYSNCTC
jgi:hypothetical protein